MTSVSVGPQGQAPVQAIEFSGDEFALGAAGLVLAFPQQLFFVVAARAAQQPVLPPAFDPLAQQQRPAARDSGEQRQTSLAELA